jgi:outer membrane receptor for ferrienterochelin and colicins
MVGMYQTLALVCGFMAVPASHAQSDTQTTAHADSPVVAQRQSSPDTAGRFDKVVVTGTRTARSIKENPANITVITREQIESSSATNVTDLLLYEPGIIVRRPIGMGEGVPSDINMRGVPGATAATRTLVLVDGIPTNAAGTPFMIINEVPMEAIERIEIVRGPYSNLYGPNAFGGVVNIITKNAGKDVHAGISCGGFTDFYDASLDANGSAGRFSFLANGAMRGIVNYYGTDSIVHKFGHYSRITNADNYGYYDRRFFGKFNYAISSRATLTLHTRYFGSDLGFGRSELGNPPASISVHGQKILAGPVLKVNITPGFDLKIGGYFRNLQGIYYDLGVTADSTHDSVQSVWRSSSNDWQVDAQSTLRLGKGNTLTAGFDVLDNAIDFGPRCDAVTGDYLNNASASDKAMQNGGLYVQDEMRLGKFVTIAGLRLDYNSIFGFVPSPRVGLIYKQNNSLRLKLSAGRAFRSPSLSELYMPDLPVNTSTTVRSEPGLKPEYIWAVDGGPELDVTKWCSVRISGFYNKMDDLVTQKVVNQYFQGILQNVTLSHKNTEKAWSAGLENSLDIRFAQWGSFFFNYTYTKSRGLITANVYGKLEYIPEHQFNTGIYFRKSFGRFSLNGSVLENYVGSRDYLDWLVTMQDISNGLKPMPLTPSDFSPTPMTLDAYFRTDASLKITYNDCVWLGIEGLNLFDAKIEESSGAFAPRRFAEMKVGVKF